MALRYYDDWQSSKKTVLQRNMYMFDNPLMSDIGFVCGDSSRVFRAHKYVLSMSSSVFYAMFYGVLAQKESIINIPDTDDESFEEFLRFLYTDDCKITAENAIQVLYLAEMYHIVPLTEKCREVLMTNVNPNNVFSVLELAILFDEKKLEAKCWGVISLQTGQCIDSEGFCDIGLHTLNALLKRKTLEIQEIELFQRVLKWIDNECAKDININDDNTARRRVLGDVVYDIRFLEMSKLDFIEHVSPTGILTEAEVAGITQQLDGLDVPGLKWKDHKVRGPHIVGFNRFDCGYTFERNMPVGKSGLDSEVIAFSVNKAVVFHGVRLLAAIIGLMHNVTLIIKGNEVESRQAGIYFPESDNDNVCGYDVMLRKPMCLLPNEEFTMIIRIKGPRFRGCKGKSSMEVDGIVVTFHLKNSSTPNAHGDINVSDENRSLLHKIFLSEL